jgi:hypothetical protein
MNAAIGNASAAHHVPERARQLATRLSALFDRDVEIVKQLNDAHQRLVNANQQLDTRAASDTLNLPDIRWRINRAFCAYQDAAERRRQLAVDVGEIAHQLTDALTQAGWTAQQAQHANVHQLAKPSHARVGNFHDREWGFPVIVDNVPRVALPVPLTRDWVVPQENLTARVADTGRVAGSARVLFVRRQGSW